jgi:16S rRNA processing protein RimM
VTRDLLLVGRIARAHGNRGQVIVNLETDFPEDRFQVGRTVFVGAEADAEPRQIRDVRFHQGRPVIALDGVETMNDAETLAGAELRMPTDAMAPLPENTFYRHDLIGCQVFDRRDCVIGRVTAVEGPLERSHLIVTGDRGDVMIPLVAEICITVDPGAQRIVVNPPEGLLELNARHETS